MKIALRLLSLLILAGVSTFYAGCKKDDDDSKTVEQQQLEKLVGDWALETATDETGDRTENFSGLVLKLEGSYNGEGQTYNYSLTGERPTPSPWPGSGSWKFGTNKASEIIRDPGGPNEIAMQYTVTDQTLIITFELPDNAEGWPGSGRVKNVIGDWTFTFTR